jgi:hypothetical protein
MFGRGRGKIRGIPLTLSLIEFEFLEQLLLDMKENVQYRKQHPEELIGLLRKMDTLREKIDTKAQLLAKFPIREE